ncbi:hypothetical protein K449DRAFT_394347 [Hypoxylon sp. EC38]|nr:hypothetical protein K449DRAFT_394347 [Hypoxylon sp. EC38]
MPPNSRNRPMSRDQEFQNNAYRSNPNQRNGPRPVPTTKIRSDPWQSVSALQLGLEPRSFAELHIERMYLLEMLQQHDRRAFQLFSRVPSVEERIRETGNKDDLIQARKHRGWLRHRIVDIIEEEKKVLARLSELHVEIQCRERWSRVERERERLKQQHNFVYESLEMLTYTQPSAQHVPGYYYPPYGCVRPDNTQHNEHSLINRDYTGYKWEQEIPANCQSTLEDPPEFEPFELEGTVIDDTPGNSSHSSQWSLEVLSELEPTKCRSMPSLSRRWSV